MIDTSAFDGQTQDTRVRTWVIILGSVIGFALLLVSTIGAIAIGHPEYEGFVVFVFLVITFAFVFKILIKTVKDAEYSMLKFTIANDLTKIETQKVMELCPPSVPQGAGTHIETYGAYSMVYSGVQIYMFQLNSREIMDKYGTYYFVTTIKTENSYPHIYLDGTKNGQDRMYKSWQRISLEGDFDKYFEVYSEKGRQVDTLSFLTPDVMANLIDTTALYDIETYDDTVAIISHETYPYSKVGMDDLSHVLDALLPKIRPQGLQSVIDPVPTVKSSRLQKKGRLLTILLTIIISAVYIYFRLLIDSQQ
ncbi:MAG: hypothetical protein JWN75_672 [Candidatus Saccharibacteria bacterium]|nr:hypothetical protein [Candidatus Saccharibacteria bacterium]